MAISISVKTKSGTFYMFNQDGDKIVFMRGLHEGEVVKFKEPLKVGGHVNMEYRARNFYNYEPSEEISVIHSTEITELTVLIS